MKVTILGNIFQLISNVYASGEIFKDVPCPQSESDFVVAKCENHSGIEAELKNIKDWQENHIKIDHGYISQVFEKIRNRPPAWAAVMISVLTFFLGLAVNVALRN